MVLTLMLLFFLIVPCSPSFSSVLYPDAYVQSSQSIALQHSTLLTFSANSVTNVLSPASDSEGGFTPSLKVGVVIHRSDTGFAIRVHDLHSYVEVNRRVRFYRKYASFPDPPKSLSTANYTLPIDPKNRALIDQKAQISTDTIIGDSTRVSEKTTIKKSIIGRHCIIGRMVKIVGCILLDHCVVEDGCVRLFRLSAELTLLQCKD